MVNPAISRAFSCELVRLEKAQKTSTEPFDDFLGLLQPRKGPKPVGPSDISDNEIARRLREAKEPEWVHLGDRLVLAVQHCHCCHSRTPYVRGVFSVERDRKSGTIRKSFCRGGNAVGLTLEPEIEQEEVPACAACLSYVADPELDELFGSVCVSPEEGQLSLRF